MRSGVLTGNDIRWRAAQVCSYNRPT